MEQTVTSSLPLPPEMIELVMHKTPYDDILKFCATNLQAYAFCNNPSFWRRMAINNLGVTGIEFDQVNRPPRIRYLELATEKDYDLGYGSENFLTMDQFIERAIRRKRYDLLDHIQKLGYTQFSQILDFAAVLNDKFLVDKYLSIDPSLAIEAALRGGHEDLYDDLSNRYPHLVSSQNEIMARAAANGGNIKLFDKVRLRAPLNSQWNIENLISHAVRSGNREMFDYIRSLLPNYQWNWTKWTYDAAQPGNQQLYDYFRGLAGNQEWDWRRLMAGALETGNVDFVKHIVSQIPPGPHLYTEGLEDYAMRGGCQTLRYFYDLDPNHDLWNWDGILIDSIGGEFYSSPKLFECIYNLAPKSIVLNWNNIFFISLQSVHPMARQYIWNMAISNGHPVDPNEFFMEYIPEGLGIDEFNWIYSRTPPDYPWNWNQILATAEGSTNPELIDRINQLKS